MKKSFTLFLILTFILLAGTATAGEKFGVTVYPGAKLDTSTSKALAEGMGLMGSAYRTKDSVSKVKAFYKGKKGFKDMGGDAQNGMYKKGKDVDVTIQSPWMNMETGVLMKDTLICIVKQQ